MKSLRLFSLLTLCIILLNSCGPSDGLHTVTLDTGLENLAPAKNLMEGLVHQMFTIGSDACLQPDVFSGYKPNASSGGNDDMNIVAKSIDMISTSAVPGTFDAAWLASPSNAVFPPIQFKAPTGYQGFGVIGSIVMPSGLFGLGGECRRFATPSSSPAQTLSLEGHVNMNITGDITVPLKVWALSPSAAPSPDPANSICTSSNGGDDGMAAQLCPSKNFQTLLCASFGVASCGGHMKLEYLFTNGNPNHVTQVIDGYASSNTYTVPDLLPMLITPLNNALPWGPDKALFTHSMVDSAMDASGVSTGMSNVILPTIEGFVTVISRGRLGAITTQQGASTNGVITWNALPNYTGLYQIQAEPGKITTMQTSSLTHACGSISSTSVNTSGCSGITFTAGSTYTIAVTPMTAVPNNPMAWIYYTPVTSAITPFGSFGSPTSNTVTFAVYDSSLSGVKAVRFALGAPNVYSSPMMPITQGVDNATYTTFTFTNVPSGASSPAFIYTVNAQGGNSSISNGNVTVTP